MANPGTSKSIIDMAEASTTARAVMSLAKVNPCTSTSINNPVVVSTSGMGIKPTLVKFGVKTSLKGDNDGVLCVLEPHQELTHTIKSMCKLWDFKNDPSAFVLVFKDGRQVTEDNRGELTGKLVTMTFSPAKVARDIIATLNQMGELSSSVIHQTLVGLGKEAENDSHSYFSEAFVREGGLPVLFGLIMEPDGPGDNNSVWLSSALRAMLNIMSKVKRVTWQQVFSAVYTRLAGFLSDVIWRHDAVLLRLSLQILLRAATLSHLAYLHVEKDVSYSTLRSLMRNPNPAVQGGALALVNALYMGANVEKKKELAQTLLTGKFMGTIYRHIILKTPERPIETNYQLYVLQCICLSWWGKRRSIAITPKDEEDIAKIKELRAIAFGFSLYSGIYEEDGWFTPKASSSSADIRLNIETTRNAPNDYRKLGFTDGMNPARDFETAPPGLLALDCMFHLATTDPTRFERILIEAALSSTPGDHCPFTRMSVKVVDLLCRVFRVGAPPKDNQSKFYTFFFQNEKAFEEIYCIVAELTVRTWKEMTARKPDFDRVFIVVEEQLRRALGKMSISPGPDSDTGLKELEKHLKQLGYKRILALQKEEQGQRDKNLVKEYNEPFRNVWKEMEPELMDLIRLRRLNYLKHGTNFPKFDSKCQRIADKVLYCRLTSNEKLLELGDGYEKRPPPQELGSIRIVDIKGLLTGTDCPHIQRTKEKHRRRINTALAFSIITCDKPLETLDFVAPDEPTFDQWMDGLHALMRQPMTSKTTASEMEMLATFELKLKILQVEELGGTVLKTAPPIPPRPRPEEYAHLLVEANEKLKKMAKAKEMAENN